LVYVLGTSVQRFVLSAMVYGASVAPFRTTIGKKLVEKIK
jgi:hypothetical protein